MQQQQHAELQLSMRQLCAFIELQAAMLFADASLCRWHTHVWLQHHCQLLQACLLQHTFQLLHQPGGMALTLHSLQGQRKKQG